MHGELPGAASAFLSVASRVEVATFFRYLREDVSSVDDDDLQAVCHDTTLLGVVMPTIR